MLATQILPEDTLDNASQDESEIIGHLAIDSQLYEIKRGENKIGRDSCCSIVIENCTISKLHAVIESDGREETFIYDCGSTNLTKLGKVKLRPHCRYKLDDGTDIVLGNIVATFKLVPERYCQQIKTSKTSCVNTQALDDDDDLDNIFDLPTQVATSGPSTSRGVPEPPNHFKTPNSLFFHKKTPTLSECKSDSGFSGLEDSDIFDQSTQCQLPGKSQECNDNERDKVKSLLNDGQDDVLCNFMLMCSPKCVDETEIDIFDGPTQIEGANKLESAKVSDEECIFKVSCDEQEDDFMISQKLNKKEGKVDGVEKVGAETDEDDQMIYTQDLEHSNNHIDESVMEIDNKEDLALSQKLDHEGKDNDEQKDGGDNDDDDEDDATQLYEVSEDQINCQNDKTNLPEFSKVIECFHSNFTNETKPAESSGDETESDLEIVHDKSFTTGEVNAQPEPLMEESQNSNDSYTFQVETKQADTDSDATDCESTTKKNEEVRVLSLTPSSPSKMNTSPERRRSPSPTCWSQLSLKMPSTQDVESTLDRVLGRDENQVGNELEQRESSLKRDRDSSGSVDPSPAKKPKRDKRLSKLWAVHDVTQIQPRRTRNSLRTPDTNNQSCRRSTRGKKLNPDVTPYLIRCREKKETPTEKSKPSRRRKSSRFETPAKKRGIKSEPPTVAFTGFESPSLADKVHALGGSKTNDLSAASVVVADKVRRTVKFLCAIGLSLPITSPQWLSTSAKENKFLNPSNFILKDKEAERKWGFNLKLSLERSKRMKLFEGYNVFATKSTRPPVKDLLAIVECCGGTPIVHKPSVWPRKTIIVSCEEDEEAWPPPRVRNIKLVHYEFILTGVLQQKIDFKSYSLR